MILPQPEWQVSFDFERYAKTSFARVSAKQADIIRAFGVTSISVKRWVKVYRARGPRGFYAPRVTRGPAVLVEGVIAEAEEMLAEGASVAEVAERLEVKPNTLQKAIRAGRIRQPAKKNASTLRR